MRVIPGDEWVELDGDLWSSEIEMSLLGAMILDSQAEIACKESRLTTRDFYRPCHKKLFSVILGVISAGGDGLIAFKDEALRLGVLDDVGGTDYMVELAEFCPSPVNAPFYAKRLKEYSTRRSVIKALEDAQKIVANGPLSADTISAIVSDIEAAANDVSDEKFTKASEVVLADIQSAGVTTGFAQLDRILDTDGYPFGQMTLVMAPPGVGKTVVMLSSAIKMALEDNHCIYVTFSDLTQEGIVRRIMKHLTGLTGERKIRNSRDRDAWNNGRQILEGLPLTVYDAGENGSQIESTLMAIRAYIRKNPEVKAVFMDYAQRINPSKSKGTDHENLNYISKEVSKFAKDLGIAVIVGSQVTKDSSGDFNTKGTRAFNEDAGFAIVVDRESEFLKVTKNRFGGNSSASITVGARVTWNEGLACFMEPLEMSL